MQKTGSAKLRWEGTLDDMNNQNITLWLTNLDLRDCGPYCEHYTAYPLTKGNLTFRSQNVIRNRYLDGTNHLDMFEPKVDKKRREIKAEMNIPLKQGLYVLKDKKGHVKMNLPVKGSLDSPEFSYRKIVLKAIGNVLLKVRDGALLIPVGQQGEPRIHQYRPAAIRLHVGAVRFAGQDRAGVAGQARNAHRPDAARQHAPRPAPGRRPQARSGWPMPSI